MRIPTGRNPPLWSHISIVLAVAALTVLVSSLQSPPENVSAHSGPVFGPACGAATVDGVVNAAEWSSASTQTFQMISAGGADPFTATLHVMNGGYYLYLGITINDDEFSTHGQYLAQGDVFRIDFDNDHSGSLFALGDDALTIGALPPQFGDKYLYALPSAIRLDVQGNGTSDGVGFASRVGDLNHFELRHPLCSGDSLDFCLHPTSILGFRLEYLDAEADGSFGGSRFFPGISSEADIVIGQCSIPDFSMYLPLVRKGSMAVRGILGGR